MLVTVTYDENAGIWDHGAPPKGDRWCPGSRIPATIVSPFAKRGFVDHTPYDTTRQKVTPFFPTKHRLSTPRSWYARRWR
jgi:phospholipase C